MRTTWTATYRGTSHTRILSEEDVRKHYNVPITGDLVAPRGVEVPISDLLAAKLDGDPEWTIRPPDPVEEEKQEQTDPPEKTEAEPAPATESKPAASARKSAGKQA